MSEQTYKVAAVQAAPVFMNLDATVDKGLELIEAAARADARLVAFPECWVPGYPWWAWLSAAAPPVQHSATEHRLTPVTVQVEPSDPIKE